MSACIVSQVGDCEWWCHEHKRDAEDCAARSCPAHEGRPHCVHTTPGTIGYGKCCQCGSPVDEHDPAPVDWHVCNVVPVDGVKHTHYVGTRCRTCGEMTVGGSR